MNDERPTDGRKYHVGDKVDFTDDEGKQVPGIVHGIRYQQGRYELVGAHRPDMHSPEGPDNMLIPGTGEMQLVPGTENERHSFEYIMVHEHEHKAWHEAEARNKARLKKHHENVKKFRGSVDPKDPDHPKNFDGMPVTESLEDLPIFTQHIRVYEPDEAAEEIPVDNPVH